MNWQLRRDRFVLEGLKGAQVFTTTRALGLPAGEVSPEGLRNIVDRCGIHPTVVVGMEQVHGGEVRVAKSRMDAVVPGCDGLVTNQRGVALVVRSADCLPIIAFDSDRRMLGLAHAGWRGVKAGLPAHLVDPFHYSSGHAQNLHIAIGPAIGPCCYEVGVDFEAWFPGHLLKKGGRFFLDLKKAAISQLTESGVLEENISVAPGCTSCDKENCFSYRQEGAAAGRMVTVTYVQ